ncbi:hypothetical protein [Allokutzneria albata]|nr:hypothetical protein [Allokutzneria albata]
MGALAAAAASAYSFSDRLITFLAIVLAIVLGSLMIGEPRRDGASTGRIVVAIAAPLIAIAAVVLLPGGTVGLLWF